MGFGGVGTCWVGALRYYPGFGPIGLGTLSPMGPGLSPMGINEPKPEDFELSASMSIRYAGFEPRFTGQMEDFGAFGGDNFLVKEGIVHEWNSTGNMGKRAD